MGWRGVLCAIGGRGPFGRHLRNPYLFSTQQRGHQNEDGLDFSTVPKILKNDPTIR